ncbi:hypothetical protein D3C83_293540 [compost metagenome]
MPMSAAGYSVAPAKPTSAPTAIMRAGVAAAPRRISTSSVNAMRQSAPAIWLP